MKDTKTIMAWGSVEVKCDKDAILPNPQTVFVYIEGVPIGGVIGVSFDIHSTGSSVMPLIELHETTYKKHADKVDKIEREGWLVISIPMEEMNQRMKDG